MTNDLLTAAEAGALIHVSDETMRRWARAGTVPHVRLPSGQIRFQRRDVLAILEPVDPDTEGGVTLDQARTPVVGDTVKVVTGLRFYGMTGEVIHIAEGRYRGTLPLLTVYRVRFRTGATQEFAIGDLVLHQDGAA